MTDIAKKAEALAIEAGMQWDSRYSHWIASRGKFEGEQWYTPYFYDAWNNGDGEDLYGDDEEPTYAATLFQLDAEEAEAFGLKCGAWILLRESSDGFVFASVHTTREKAEKKFHDWIGG